MTKKLTGYSVKGHSTTNDTNNSCHIKAVELVEHFILEQAFTCKTLYKYLQRTHRNFADFWDFKNTRKLAMPQNKIGHKKVWT